MIYDIQKASIVKRASAWMLDMIILLVIVTGLGAALSTAFGLSDYIDRLQTSYDHYESQFGVSFETSQEEYEAMTQEDKDNYDAAYNALIADDQVLYVYNMVINLTLVIVSVSVLGGYMITEFAVPIFLKNGQTLGKKVFGLAVVRTNAVSINNICLFIRTVLGKATVETMVPVMVMIMLMLNIAGVGATMVVGALLLVQIVMLIVTRYNCAIHDRLADTVVVDMASQMIFRTEEDLIEYKKRISAEETAGKEYF